MKPEDQNRTIAHFCGWREAFPKSGEAHPDTRRGGILLPYNWINEVTKQRLMELPDYFNDLNAIHEAENMISVHADTYMAALKMETSCSGPMVWKEYQTCIATASQRARALLKTIGKWRDE